MSGVAYSAGGRAILADVAATFPGGRVSVVLGPNGAGKSTLLKIAAGLLAASAGDVSYGGRAVASFAPAELARTRALLSQHVELAFPLAVEDVVLMGRYPHFGRSPASRDRAVVDAALALVGIADRRRQAYPTLSGGEQQKTQLARVLAQIWSDERSGEPKALFLDEPTANLDVHHQIHILETARELARAGCTVVAVLHDLNTALEFGDRFLLLDAGRVVQMASRREELGADVLERVFQVRARAVADPGRGDVVWRFSR